MLTSLIEYTTNIYWFEYEKCMVIILFLFILYSLQCGTCHTSNSVQLIGVELPDLAMAVRRLYIVTSWYDLVLLKMWLKSMDNRSRFAVGFWLNRYNQTSRENYKRGQGMVQDLNLLLTSPLLQRSNT